MSKLLIFNYFLVIDKIKAVLNNGYLQLADWGFQNGQHHFHSLLFLK